MSVARHVRVSGRVQGVWFRAWTKEQATALAIGGWVRNCDDGSVEAHLEGEAAAVDQLVEKMRRGPPGARVDDLQSREVTLEGLSEFAITR